jgi:GT2 family glycosyltransferase
MEILTEPTPIETSAKTAELPFVSVVMPCYNEQRFITNSLQCLAGQYEKDCYEIIVVDGLSTDKTRELIEKFRQTEPNLSLKVIDNRARYIPAALNLGVAAARGSIIARMDAHAVPTDGYVKRCVEVLASGETGVVGMPCQVKAGANTLIAHAIATAVSHPFGVGDAKYRLSEGGPLQEHVDTVAFACFKKSLWQQLGGFDETLLTNEDYDFNYRVRRAGYSVILDRSGHCDYFARATLKGLAAQYRRYGTWKARMLKQHPLSIRPRHLVAPVFVLSLLVLPVGGFIWFPLWQLLAAELLSYLLVACFFSFTAKHDGPGGVKFRLLLPLIFLTIHLNWGAAFFRGLVTERKEKRRRTKVSSSTKVGSVGPQK